MFAGEGGPERTNRRFHYLSLGMPAKRLSTAFDSVTLYGNDPDHRPDIYGKVGNSGVNISSLNDAKKLYSGFDLCDPKTSVSMTINGPAATICAFFMNAAIDQQCELYIKQNGLEEKVEAAFSEQYDDRDIERPRYEGDLPEGNDGLGLMLLGLTGDQILDAEVYNQLKAKPSLQYGAQYKPTFSRKTKRRIPVSSLLNFPCGSWETYSSILLTTRSATFTPSLSLVIILLRLGPIPYPSWLLHCPMVSHLSSTTCHGAWI